MSDYSRLWESIRNHVTSIRGFQQSSLIGSSDDLRLTHRTAQIFMLDVFLHQHREKYGTGVFPLRGRNTLNHAILLKYKWPLATISALPLDECLFAIQDELVPENLPEGAQRFLLAVMEKASQLAFDDFRNEEWNQELGELFLRMRRL